jgi:hypothetical protein
VVFATDEARARSLLGTLVSRSRFGREPVQWNRTTTFYYAAERAPVEEPILVLNGEGVNAGQVNNAVVISQASERYAPAGAHLVAASVLSRAPQSERRMEQLERETREQLQRWFGQDVARWAVVGGYPSCKRCLCAGTWIGSRARHVWPTAFTCAVLRQIS